MKNIRRLNNPQSPKGFKPKSKSADKCPVCQKLTINKYSTADIIDSGKRPIARGTINVDMLFCHNQNCTLTYHFDQTGGNFYINTINTGCFYVLFTREQYTVYWQAKKGQYPMRLLYSNKLTLPTKFYKTKFLHYLSLNIKDTAEKFLLVL